MSSKPQVRVFLAAVMGWFEVLLRLDILIEWQSSENQVPMTPSFSPNLMSYQLTLKP